MSYSMTDSSSPLTPDERTLFQAALMAALPWRKSGPADHLVERYDAIEQSLLLQVEHNDLQLPAGDSPQERRAFLVDVIVPLVVNQTLRSIAQPGTPVGIESATSTGRVSTQMNLNSFHQAGQLNTQLQQGVPRLNELFNATRDMKQPMMVIRVHGNSAWTTTTGGGVVDTLPPGFHPMHQFKRWTRFWFEYRTLLNLIDMNGKPYVLYRPETFAGLPNPEPYWYKPWRAVYGEMRACSMPQADPTAIWHTVRVRLNKLAMVQYQLSMSYIAQVLQESVLWAKTKKRLGAWTPLIHIIASPDYEATLDIHVRVDHVPPLERIYRKARIQPSRQGQILLNETKRRELFLTQVVMYELMSVRVCGVPGLLEISWRTRSDPAAVIEKKKASDGKYLPAPHLGWEVITRGSSLREVISMPQVDVPSLVTNNPFQVLDVLGIEAARKLYLVELRACMNNADEAMLQTAVDSMLHKGLITPANRFGANPMDGPLTRASNEMSTQTLLRAATSHQRESLAGVSASTMLGQPMRIGTGLPKLLWDEEAWLEMREEPILNAKVVIDPVTYQPAQSGISSLMSKLSLVTGRTYQASDVEEV